MIKWLRAFFEVPNENPPSKESLMKAAREAEKLRGISEPILTLCKTMQARPKRFKISRIVDDRRCATAGIFLEQGTLLDTKTGLTFGGVFGRHFTRHHSTIVREVLVNNLGFNPTQKEIGFMIDFLYNDWRLKGRLRKQRMDQARFNRKDAAAREAVRKQLEV